MLDRLDADAVFGTKTAKAESFKERVDRLRTVGKLTFREIAAADGIEFMDFMNKYEGREGKRRQRRQPAPRPAPINRAKPGVRVVFVEPRKV